MIPLCTECLVLLWTYEEKSLQKSLSMNLNFYVPASTPQHLSNLITSELHQAILIKKAKKNSLQSCFPTITRMDSL